MTFTQRLKKALVEIFTSKKVLMTLAGFTAAYLAKRGIVFSPDDLISILIASGIAVGGQAAADVGKNAAIVRAENPPPPETIAAGGDVNVNTKPK